MTNRNLNKTWFDILVTQYQRDFSDHVAFPVRYLLYNPQHKADLFYLVPKPIDPELFRESLINFNIYTRLRASPDFHDENLTVWQRVKHSTVGVEGGDARSEVVSGGGRRQQQQQQRLDDTAVVEDSEARRLY